ncbi:MAG: hypothetical protein QY323_04485 [Patescibacteria group bacterium]|nr:MAG: hypothetical protein QY323_04485 [Patescibacteria group bacterium]
MTNVLSFAERNALRPIADAWMGNYNIALDDAGFEAGTPLAQWIEIAWTKGFLDHVSPTDPQVREARARMGRTLWRERHDPVLYWRAQYAFENVRATMNHTRTSGPAARAFMDLYVAMTKIDKTKLQEFFPKLRHHSQWPWQEKVCELLIGKAQTKLREMGVTPHDPTLRRRSAGTFRGMEVTIRSILDDGSLALTPAAPGPRNENIIKLLNLTDEMKGDAQGICPSLIDAAAFTSHKGKDR